MGYKIVVSKSGRAGDPDHSKLEGVLQKGAWEEITDEVVEVRPSTWAERMRRGR